VTVASPDDEFSLLAENAAEAGIPWSRSPTVRRESVEVAAGRRVSAVVWGSGPPELVLLHGGGQNAHTWDTVALALDQPLVALDLPGHGHSGWRDDHDYTPAANASDVAAALRHLVPGPRAVVGMSLGGLTALCLAADHPDLVARLALVDITPGTDSAKAEPILAFLSGPERFGSFQEILDRTMAFNPTRSASSLRRGVIHNAREFADGSWSWRWDPAARWRAGGTGFDSLWPALRGAQGPLLLVRGSRSSVVSDDDVARVLQLRPDALLEIVADAGHSIQGDQPVALAQCLSRFLAVQPAG
jgi:pimeloyl-ACP methyl ester carboxylesterase